MLGLIVMLAAAGCSSPSAPSQIPGGPSSPGTPGAQLALSCPASLSATALTGTSTSVSFGVPTASGGVAPVRVSCSPDSGSTFPVGSTLVRCTATDAAAATASCTFNVAVTAVPRLSRTRILAFGDSMTAGEVTEPMRVERSGETSYRLILVPAASYPTQLSTLLKGRYLAQVSSLDVINAGKPSEWAEDGALRFPGVMANQRPEVVLLMQGTNDLAALGTPGVASAARAIETMAKEARLRGARVFLATVPPVRSDAKLPIPAALIASLNDQIRRTALGEGAVVVDVHAALAADLARYFGVDGLHPNEAGYRRIAEVFFDAIRADLEVR